MCELSPPDQSCPLLTEGNDTMPAPRVRADYDTLTRMAQSFTQHAASTRQSLQQMRQRMDVLQGGDWVGQGATAFFREMTSDVLPAFNRLLTSLEQAGQNTKKMSDIMKQAEEDAARFFRLDGVVGAAVPSGAIPSEPAGGEGAGTAAAATTQAKMSRDQAKKVAAGASVAMNKMAAALAGGAAVFAGVGIATGLTGVGAAVGAGGVVVCGLGSAAAWWMSADYQQLANDPPRADFQTATKFEPPQFDFKAPVDEDEATWQELTKLLATQSVAMKALVTSLERYDGVQAAMKKPEGDGVTRDKQRGYEVAQAEAVAHNAAACAQVADSLLELRQGANDAWRHLREVLAAAGSAATELSAEDLKRGYAQMWESNLGSLQQSLKFSESDIAELQKIVDQRMQAQPLSTQLPDVVFDDDWSGAMRAASAQLRQLADSYARLKSALTRS